WTRGTRCTADDLRPARIHACRWPDELRNELYRGISPGRRLQRQNFGRRATGRVAGGAISQVRATDQPQGRQVARPHNSARRPRDHRRGDRMKRREFITLLGGAAAAWPMAARAQLADRIARIGYIGPDRTAAPLGAAIYQAFLDEMQIHGFKNGQNLVVEF